MRKTLKVGFALAIAALALTITALAVSSAASSANVSAQVAHSGQAAAQSSSEQSPGYVATSDGCQDAAAQVTGYDPLTGMACYSAP